VPQGNDRVPDNDHGKHLVLHTVAHEVNHILNDDVPRPSSFQHFEIEYRASAVGFKAEHGHWPTNKEAMERVRHELTAKDGGYQDIKGTIGKLPRWHGDHPFPRAGHRSPRQRGQYRRHPQI
jgi:hypothetical protein